MVKKYEEIDDFDESHSSMPTYTDLVRNEPNPKSKDKKSKESEPTSLTTSTEDVSELSDVELIARRLFPSHLGTENANALMVSRISPNVFLPLWHIMCTDEVMASDPRAPINVTEIRQRNYSMFTIGLDGQGRIDLAELAGVAREISQNDRNGLSGI